MKEVFCKVNETPHRVDNTLTPDEARELLNCFVHESYRRYGKVNMEAPLYLKLKEIVTGLG